MIHRYLFIYMLFNATLCLCGEKSTTTPIVPAPLKSDAKQAAEQRKLNQQYPHAYTAAQCFHRMTYLSHSLQPNEQSYKHRTKIAESLFKNFDKFTDKTAIAFIEKVQALMAKPIENETDKNTLTNYYAEIILGSQFKAHKAIILKVDPSLKLAFEYLEKYKQL